MPDVEAPEGSGFATGAFGRVACLGRVPDVDGVGDEQELLPVLEPLELDGATGVGAGTGGATGGDVLEGALVGPNGCSLGTVVQLYWNSGTVSSSPVRNLYTSEVSNIVHNFFSSGVNCSKVFFH